MTYDEILVEHSKKIGVSLKPDETGLCTFQVEKKFLVCLEPNNLGSFFLFAPITSVTADNEARVMKTALAANLFGKDTGLASFAYDPNSKVLILCQRFDEEYLTFAFYEKQFSEFMRYMKFWVEEIHRDHEHVVKSISSLGDARQGIKI